MTLAFVLLSGAMFALAPEARESNAPTAGLPDAADSTTVARLQQSLPSSDMSPAIIVVSRDGETLDATDRSAVADLSGTLDDFSVGDPERAVEPEDKVSVRG